MKWEKVKLGDCCEITSSKRIFYSDYVEFGVPFYRSKEIIERSQGKVISEPLYITQEKYDYIKERFGVPQEGDMLLTSVGTIGIPYIVKKDDYFYFKDGNLTWFRNFNNNLSSQYLYSWICSSDGIGTLYNTTIGSSQKALTISSLNNIKIPCPPIAIQQKIVSILSNYDNLIENNQKQIKLLEEAAQRLYREWFVDLRFPGHETVNVVDGVPEGWRKSRIGDEIRTFSGGTPSRRNPDFYKNGKNLWIKTQELTDSFIFDTEEKITDDGIKRSSAKRIQPNSILLAMYGATIGKLGITTSEATCNQACCVFDFSNCEYMMWYLYNWLIENRIFLISQGKGAAQPNLSQEMIKKFELLVPSKHILTLFSELVNSYYNTIKVLQKQIILLTEARDRLLPKLMSGELEV